MSQKDRKKRDRKPSGKKSKKKNKKKRKKKPAKKREREALREAESTPFTPQIEVLPPTSDEPDSDPRLRWVEETEELFLQGRPGFDGSTCVHRRNHRTIREDGEALSATGPEELVEETRTRHATPIYYSYLSPYGYLVPCVGHYEVTTNTRFSRRTGAD